MQKCFAVSWIALVKSFSTLLSALVIFHGAFVIHTAAVRFRAAENAPARSVRRCSPSRLHSHDHYEENYQSAGCGTCTCRVLQCDRQSHPEQESSSSSSRRTDPTKTKATVLHVPFGSPPEGLSDQSAEDSKGPSLSAFFNSRDEYFMAGAR